MTRGLENYKPVKQRIHEMRTEHPAWSIATAVEFIDDCWHCKTTIRDDEGHLISTGFAVEKNTKPFDAEKAETSAVGRALVFAGWTDSLALSLEEEERSDQVPIPVIVDETRRAKDAVYAACKHDKDDALAMWGDLMSSHGWNPPLTPTQADQIIREAQSLLSAAPDAPTLDEPGRVTPSPARADAAHGAGSGRSSSGGSPLPQPSSPLPPEEPSPIAVAVDLAAHEPTERNTKVEMDRQVRDLFDAMWRLDIWTADSLVDALDGKELSSLNKTDLRSFTRAWCKRAQTDLVADAPGGTR